MNALLVASAAAAQPPAPAVTTAQTLFMLASMVMYVLVWVALTRLLHRTGLSRWMGVPVAWLATFVIWLFVCVFAIGLDIPIPMTLIALGGGAWALFATRRKAADSIAAAAPPASPAQAIAPAAARAAEPVATPPTEPVPLPVQQPPAPPADAVHRGASDLVRLVEGMMADGAFVQAEADYLFQWLRDNSDRLDQHPFNVIYQRLTDALADGVLDDDEAADLGDLFKRLVLDEPGDVEKIATSLAAPPKPAPIPTPAQAAVEPVAKPKRARRTKARAGIDHVLINYRDSLGLESEREVTVHSVDWNYVKGFCHMRNAIRSFRFDRIVGDVIRTETGEAMAADDWRLDLLATCWAVE